MAVAGGLRSRSHRATWILGQGAVVVLSVLAYFWTRGVTEGTADIAVVHGRGIAELEGWLGLDIEEELQAPVAASPSLATLANWIYIWGHWPVIVTTMVWLAVRHSAVFLELRDAMLISGAMGMLVYVSYPVAPPRLAGLGMIDTVTERSTSYRVLQPPAFVDQYAAMPSLHAGWDLLVGIAIVTAASTLALRVVGYVMPILMAASVVVTANHYILDVVAGAAFVLVGHYVAVALRARRDGRAAADPTKNMHPHGAHRPEPGDDACELVRG